MNTSVKIHYAVLALVTATAIVTVTLVFWRWQHDRRNMFLVAMSLLILSIIFVGLFETPH
jgi:predicted neutral ceramidase superfamily lipid hydrolase